MGEGAVNVKNQGSMAASALGKNVWAEAEAGGGDFLARRRTWQFILLATHVSGIFPISLGFNHSSRKSSCESGLFTLPFFPLLLFLWLSSSSSYCLAPCGKATPSKR